MKTKNLHRHVGRVVHALMLTMLFLWGGNVTASALEGSGTTTDPYVLENGSEFSVASYKSWYAKFTAPSDGRLSINTSDIWAVYTDEKFSTKGSTATFIGNYSDKAYYIECEAGVTYYIGNSFVMNGGDCTVTFLGSGETLAIELSTVSPADGETLNVATAQVSLSFNQNVAVSSATVTAGNESVTLSVNTHGAYASVDLKKQMAAWYADGTLHADDNVEVVFNGITAAGNSDVKYGEDGTLTLTYTAGAKPLLLTDSKNTSGTFYSYFMSDDPAGSVELDFDGKVNMDGDNAPTAMLLYGNQELDGEYTQVEVPITAIMNYESGSILLVNLRGVKRAPSDLLPNSQTSYETIALRISGVRDAEGNYAYSDQSGSVGSYTFQYDYKEVDYQPTCDWTPAKVLNNDTKNIEYWLEEKGDKKATFSGATFSYVSGGETKTENVTISDANIVADPNNENARTITIPVPNISADANSDITVALSNVERPDGLTDDVSMGIFSNTFSTDGLVADEFEITAADWNNGTETVSMIDGQIGRLTSKTETAVKTNKDSEIGYVAWKLETFDTSAPDGGYIREGYARRDGEFPSFTDDGFTITWYNEELLSGYNYTFTLKAWKSYAEYTSDVEPTVGTASFEITGLQSTYVYSDVEMTTDISETIALLSSSDTYRTFEFSDKVKVTALVSLGFGTTADCTVEATGNSDGEYSDGWKVTIPGTVLASMEAFNVSLWAVDQEGKAVNKVKDDKGTVHENKENTYFEIAFTSEFNKPDFTVSPADGSEVKSISKITFSYDPAISINWGSATDAVITVSDRTNRTEIATFSKNEVLESNEGMYIELPDAITETGTYVISIPAEFFVLGEDKSTSLSKLTTVTYVISGAVTPSDIKVVADPAVGTVTEIPTTIRLTFPDMSSVGQQGDNPYITDDKNNTYNASFDYDWDADMNVILVKLSESITGNGTYTLTIPAGALAFNDDGDVNDAPIVLTWTIGTVDGIDNIVVNAGGKVNVYTINGVLVLRNADAAAVKALAKGLYIINGKKVVIK